jgi:quercetin dioxygenase-like cupin family protein
MSHITIQDATSSVEIQAGAVVSKVVHHDDDIDVTVFGFDAGEGLTEHTAARPAIVQVLSGRMRFSVEKDEVQMVPGTWVHMSAGAAHSLTAVEPTVKPQIGRRSPAVWGESDRGCRKPSRSLPAIRARLRLRRANPMGLKAVLIVA